MTAFTPEQMRCAGGTKTMKRRRCGDCADSTLPTPPLSAPPPTNSTRCGICCSSAAIGSLAVAASNGQSMTTTSLTQSFWSRLAAILDPDTKEDVDDD